MSFQLENPPAQNAYPYMLCGRTEFRPTSYDTLVKTRTECPVCHLWYYWPCYDYVNTSTPAHFRCGSCTINLVTNANRNYACFTAEIRSCNIDLKSQEITCMCHKRIVSFVDRLLIQLSYLIHMTNSLMIAYDELRSLL